MVTFNFQRERQQPLSCRLLPPVGGGPTFGFVQLFGLMLPRCTQCGPSLSRRPATSPAIVVDMPVNGLRDDLVHPVSADAHRAGATVAPGEPNAGKHFSSTIGYLHRDVGPA